MRKKNHARSMGIKVEMGELIEKIRRTKCRISQWERKPFMMERLLENGGRLKEVLKNSRTQMTKKGGEAG